MFDIVRLTIPPLLEAEADVVSKPSHMLPDPRVM
jgi:hypothetical protein